MKQRQPNRPALSLSVSTGPGLSALEKTAGDASELPTSPSLGVHEKLATVWLWGQRQVKLHSPSRAEVPVSLALNVQGQDAGYEGTWPPNVCLAHACNIRANSPCPKASQACVSEIILCASLSLLYCFSLLTYCILSVLRHAFWGDKTNNFLKSPHICFFKVKNSRKIEIFKNVILLKFSVPFSYR